MSRLGEMSDQWRLSQNVMHYLGEGDFIMFDETPISTIELPKGLFEMFPDISLPEKLT